MACRWQRKWTDFCTTTLGSGSAWRANNSDYEDLYVCALQCQSALMLAGGTGDTGFHLMNQPCGVESKCYEKLEGTLERFANIVGGLP